MGFEQGHGAVGVAGQHGLEDLAMLVLHVAGAVASGTERRR